MSETRITHRNKQIHVYSGGRGGDRMVVGFTTTYAICVDHH
jgi:hypothetical protein